MKTTLAILFLLMVFEMSYSQNNNTSTLKLDDYSCAPCSEGLIVFYDIDGLVRNCIERASSPNYCEIHTNNIDGVNFDYTYKKGKFRVLKTGLHYDSNDMEYLSYSDGRKYDIHGVYQDDDGNERHFIYFKFKTKLPMVVNDTIYFSRKAKKDAVRRYKYNKLSFNLLEPSKALLLYGRKGRFGAIIVNIE